VFRSALTRAGPRPRLSRWPWSSRLPGQV
jgi:hypothetical protein